MIPIVLGMRGHIGRNGPGRLFCCGRTWGADASKQSGTGCRSVSEATLFNVPTMAIRMKIQRHSGPAGARRSRPSPFLRSSLRNYRSMSAPMRSKKTMQPIDRIFPVDSGAP